MLGNYIHFIVLNGTGLVVDNVLMQKKRGGTSWTCKASSVELLGSDVKLVVARGLSHAAVSSVGGQ